MISKYDLYDLSFSLITIRNNIHDMLNIMVLLKIQEVLQEKEDLSDNQIRKAISVIDGLDHDYWFFAFHNNVYVNHAFLKDNDIYILLYKLIQIVIIALRQKEYEKAEDLVDCFHSLPEIIANNHFIIPNTYWKTHVRNYRKKWDNHFLKSEEKFFKKKLFSGAKTG